MGYAELLEKLQSLPSDKQSEVIDFVEFLASRPQARSVENHTKSKSALSDFRTHPFTVETFSPMSREEANAR